MAPQRPGPWSSLCAALSFSFVPLLPPSPCAFASPVGTLAPCGASPGRGPAEAPPAGRASIIRSAWVWAGPGWAARTTASEAARVNGTCIGGAASTSPATPRPASSGPVKPRPDPASCRRVRRGGPLARCRYSNGGSAVGQPKKTYLCCCNVGHTPLLAGRMEIGGCCSLTWFASLRPVPYTLHTDRRRALCGST